MIPGYPYMFQNYNQNPNGFATVQNEQEARFYPVAPGVSMTLKDESGPFIYTKTMGRTALDLPAFEKYRLVKEEPTANAPEATETDAKVESVDLSAYAFKEDIRALEEQLAALQKEIATMKPKKKQVKEAEVEDDE